MGIITNIKQDKPVSYNRKEWEDKFINADSSKRKEFDDIAEQNRRDILDKLEHQHSSRGRRGLMNRSSEPPSMNQNVDIKLTDDFCECIFKGKPIKIQRKFREHILDRYECMALAKGMTIEIHNLFSNGRTYGVRGTIRPQSDGTYKFKSQTPVPNNPNYDISDIMYEEDHKNESHKYESEDDISIIDEAALSDAEQDLRERLSLDAFSDDDDAQMAALIASPTLMQVTPIGKSGSVAPLYIPTFDTIYPTGNIGGEDVLPVQNEAVKSPRIVDEDLVDAISRVWNESLLEYEFIRNYMLDEELRITDMDEDLFAETDDVMEGYFNEDAEGLPFDEADAEDAAKATA